MNILFFEDIINPEKGGVQRVTSILAQKLRKEKHLVFVCYFVKDDYNNWQEYFDDIFFFNNNLNELSYFISKYAIDIVINQAILCNNQPLFDLKKNHKYKIISAFHTCPDFPILTCRDKSLSHPYQFVRKCIKQFYLKFKRDDIKWLRIAAHHSECIVVLSNSFINTIKCQIAPSNCPVYAIPNPLSFDRTIPIDELLINKKKEVLVVSRMEFSPKRIFLVLNIWKSIFEKHNDWHLYLVGDGSDLLSLKQQATTQKLRNIHFEGYKNPIPYYKRASIFMMTSSYEGFGMTLTDCQQYGVVPIVFDTVPVFHDIIQQNRNGILIEEGNINEYIETINSLMNDREFCLELAKNGIIDSQKFDQNNVIAEWWQLIQKISKSF